MGLQQRVLSPLLLLLPVADAFISPHSTGCGLNSVPRCRTVVAGELSGEYDVAVVGAGIGGLCAAAVLTQCYGKRVAVLESHYLAGGCAHAFERKSADGTSYTFDSGPTIVLGCSAPPYNPLRQVLNAVGASDAVEWIPYDGWGMVVPPDETPKRADGQWKLQLGPGHFQRGPLEEFGGPEALKEFEALRDACNPLVAAAADIPAMAMRGDSWSLLPLLRHFEALKTLAGEGEVATGPFAPFLDGPRFVVTDPWLRAWLDALAFSLSGLPAAETSAAAMAYILFDMHREGAALDYPKGGMGAIIDALVASIEGGGSTVALSTPVERIDLDAQGKRAMGVTYKGGRRLTTRTGVVCNAPIWSLAKLLGTGTGGGDGGGDGGDDATDKPATAGGSAAGIAMTRSYLHLHLALDATDLDLEALEAHYTVMDKGLLGDSAHVCSEANMVAVSNPCRLDASLAPPGKIVVHAYCCGNEPYEAWEAEEPAYGASPKRRGEYEALKEERAQVLWRAVERVIPDARSRCELALIGSPLTHERFLNRPRGTYGATFDTVLPDCSTPIDGLVLCGDSVFPGIGVPAVAVNGASAANSLVNPLEHWLKMDALTAEGKM